MSETLRMSFIDGDDIGVISSTSGDSFETIKLTFHELNALYDFILKIQRAAYGAGREGLAREMQRLIEGS